MNAEEEPMKRPTKKMAKITSKREKRKSDDTRNSVAESSTSCNVGKDGNTNQSSSHGTALSATVSKSGPKPKKMRLPKDVNAPRQPLTGYVRYLQDHRERAKEANSNLGFAEITKILAAEWTHLPSEEKQRYLDEALKDRERYQKELEKYQQSETYQLFLKKQKDNKEKSALEAVSQEPLNGESVSAESGSKNGSRDVEMTDGTTTMASSSTLGAPLPSSFDIPIFTEEFLDHNRAREAELRHLRKLNTEYEEQNAILSKHIENMKAAIDKLEVETGQRKSNNEALADHLSKLRSTLTSSFASISIPSTGEKPTLDTIDSYMQKLYTKLVKEKGANKENEMVLDQVQNIISRIDYNFQ